jgi:Flp pilus assembly CpaE family ATPase
MINEIPATRDGLAPPQSRSLNETRTLIAIGDPTRERLVLQVLAETVEDGPALRLVRRCLDAEALLGSIQAGEVDAAIVSVDLHGLGVDALRALAQVRIPLVVWGLTAATAPEALRVAPVTILPRDVDIAELRAAVRGLATTGGRLRRPANSTTTRAAELENAIMGANATLEPPSPGVSGGGTVIAMVGAPGGQGVSVLAAGLTAALGRRASAALVDLNLEVPSQALALDLNPARNLYMVLHEIGTRDDASLWARLLESELQPLDRSLPRAVVLAGAPGAGLAASVGADSVRQLLRQLARHEQFVVVDVGSSLDGHTPVAAAHRAALETADRVFVVARADLIGLRRAAHLLEDLRGSLDHDADRLALVLNQHQPRYHHDSVEVARALRTTVAAVIPADPKSTQAALAAQRPLVAFGSARRRPPGHCLSWRDPLKTRRFRKQRARRAAPHALASPGRARSGHWRGKGDVHD